VKTRYKADNKTLLRVNELHSGTIEKDLQDNILRHLTKIINDIDVLIFSDFNYGCIPQCLLLEIMELIKGKKIITAADSQCSSQIGDISRFKKISLITPTEFEARISLRNNDDGLTTLGKKLMEKTNVDNIILKLGSQGLLIFPNKDKNFKEDKLDALNQNPVDISGAGDSLLIAAALSLAAGASIYESGLIGSIAAAIQVGRLGNIPLELSSLYNIIQEDKIYSVI
jgi:bifunctional ADP-heptose synthase (sugar kinase/adenylyltransferase)